jgi:uncharacterized cofD-like protein
MLLKWLTIGLHVKRWLLLLAIGILLIGMGFAFMVLHMFSVTSTLPFELTGWHILAVTTAGVISVPLALLKLSRNLLAPYRRHQQGRVIDVVYAHNKRQKGIKVVAIGGGTGLPAVLRGLKSSTSNITAVVTVADDGGSSGRLRRDLGVLPPGDLRNNIAALADDESLMTQLFQYRFNTGDLGGHAFGNLFIAALAGVSGGLESALVEVERVLNIQGRVLPATLDDVNLVADIRLNNRQNTVRIQGESKISEAGGQIAAIELCPTDAVAYRESVRAIQQADMIVIGPGSLYTSILPNLLVKGIAEALRQTQAVKIYVCNVATQPGETENYTVADHVLALEQYIGRGIFQAVVANSATPIRNAGVNTHYVRPAPPDHQVLQRYNVLLTDLTDAERPWRHDPHKLAEALYKLYDSEKLGSSVTLEYT